MPDSAETPIQVAGRHVREGQTRVARQEALIADLELDAHDHMLPKANKLLKEMRELQAQAEEHLAKLLAESVDENQS